MDTQHIPEEHEQVGYDEWSDEDVYVTLERQDGDQDGMCATDEETDPILQQVSNETLEQLRWEREERVKCMMQENRAAMCVAGSSKGHELAAKALKILEEYQFENDPLAKNLMNDLGVTKMEVVPYPYHEESSKTTPPMSPVLEGNYQIGNDIEMSEKSDFAAGPHHHDEVQQGQYQGSHHEFVPEFAAAHHQREEQQGPYHQASYYQSDSNFTARLQHVEHHDGAYTQGSRHPGDLSFTVGTQCQSGYPQGAQQQGDHYQEAHQHGANNPGAHHQGPDDHYARVVASGNHHHGYRHEGMTSTGGDTTKEHAANVLPISDESSVGCTSKGTENPGGAPTSPEDHDKDGQNLGKLTH